MINNKLKVSLLNSGQQFLGIMSGVILLSSSAVGSTVGSMTVAGKVTADSFSGDGSALTNLPVDGFYVSTILVSPVGTHVENGGALGDALTDLAGSASASSPYLLKIEPGTYDLGSNGLAMLEYVDVEGSGEGITKITSTKCAGTFPNLEGTINGADNSELRFITVENTGSGSYCPAIANDNAASNLLRITALASGDADRNYAIYNYKSAPMIAQSNVLSSAGAFSYGIRNFHADPMITQTTVSASGGSSSNTGILSEEGSPVITRSTILASGGNNSTGIYNANGATATIEGSIISASQGTSTNKGIYNFSLPAGATSSLSVVNTVVTASGGSNSYGIFNVSSAASMSNVIAVGKDGTNNYGLYNSGDAQTYSIDRSTFEGSTFSANNHPGHTLNISSSKLVGAANTSGTFNCMGVALDNGAAYVATDTNCVVIP